MSEYRLSDEAEQDVAEMYRRGFWRFGEHKADKFTVSSLIALSCYLPSLKVANRLTIFILNYAELGSIPIQFFTYLGIMACMCCALMRQSQIVKSEYMAKAFNTGSSKKSDH